MRKKALKFALLFNNCDPIDNGALDMLFSEVAIEPDRHGDWILDGVHRVWMDEPYSRKVPTWVVYYPPLDEYIFDEDKIPESRQRKIWRDLWKYLTAELDKLGISYDTSNGIISSSPDIGVERHEDGTYSWDT